VANHRDLNGELIELYIAAVEKINLLRPTVAAAHFLMFAAFDK